MLPFSQSDLDKLKAGNTVQIGSSEYSMQLSNSSDGPVYEVASDGETVATAKTALRALIDAVSRS